MTPIYPDQQPNLLARVARPFFIFCFAFFFTQYLAAQPSITAVTPNAGDAGSTIVITGTNFSATTTNNIVFFGGVRATVTAATTSSLSVNVPTGAAHGALTVAVSGLTAFAPRPFNITHAGPGTIDTESFEQGYLPITGPTSPIAIVLGDFDGDGRPDRAMTEDYGSQVVVARNITGTLQTPQFTGRDLYSTSYGTHGMAVGDLNGDGKPELLVANRNSSNISVLLNTTTAIGTISFSGAGSFPVMVAPESIVISDINMDGKPDIVSGNDASSYVTLLTNNASVGNIGFAAKRDISISYGSSVIAVADVDGDGKPDIIATSRDDGAPALSGFSVLRNTTTPGGTASFAPYYHVAAGAIPIDMVADDFDGDGLADIALVTNGNKLSVFKSTSGGGSISFNPQVDLTTTGTTSDMAADDFDGDGRIDIAVCASTNNLYLFKNTSSSGTISFNAFVDCATPSTCQSMAVADMDGDGKPDVIGGTQTSNGLFGLRNLIHEPRITSFTPNTGGTGTTVTITGKYFTGASQVEFGGAAASSITVDSDNQITAIVGTGGNGYVVVRTPGGMGRRLTFSYIPPPTITSFTPVESYAGGTVTITGTNFYNATAVSFGGVAATSFTISANGRTITAIVASGATGSVSVTTPGGTATRSGFTFNTSPTITSFSPTSAGFAQQVVITGTGFTGSITVTFGGVQAASVYVSSPTLIYASPGWNGASGNVVVTSSTRGPASMAGFTYINRPTVTSITPNAARSGETVTITGSGFSDVTEVRLAGALVASFVIVSNTTITAVVGSGATGSVWVTGPGGTTTASSFTFLTPPVVSSFTPTSAGTGETITITGSNFAGLTDISFGGTPASSITFVSPTEVRAVVGTGATGDLSVTTAGGTGNLAGFVFNTPLAIPPPEIHSFAPVAAMTGETVTITGTGFTGVTEIRFGDKPAASFRVTSSTTIRAVVGSGNSGAITVTSPEGTGGLHGFQYIRTVSNVVVYPNPASGWVWVQHPVSENAVQLKVVDMYGRVLRMVMIPAGMYKTRVDLYGLPAGCYRILLQGGGYGQSENLIVR